MRTAATRVQVIGGRIFAALGVAQFFLAGLGVFQASSFGPHAAVGTALQALSLVLVIAAVAARRAVGTSVLLLVLSGLQTVLAGLADGAPAVAALHPVNGLVLLFLADAVSRGVGLGDLGPGRRAHGGGRAREG